MDLPIGARGICCHAANWDRFAPAAAPRITAPAALAAVLLIIVLAGGSPAGAQEASQHRFFGFAGDVTVDGEPIPPGAVIRVTADGVEIGRTEVNAAGAWVLDIDRDDFDGAGCNLVFEVDGLRGVHSADCSRRVRFALKSGDARGSGVAAVETAESSGGELDASASLVRPAPPRTGGGGLAESRSGAAPAWPRAAAISAILILAAAGAALLLSRRSDGGA